MRLLNVYRAPHGYLLAPKPEGVPCPHYTWLGYVSTDSFDERVQRQLARDLEFEAFAVLTASQFYGVRHHDPSPRH
ncbi:hypothetical protein LVB87_05850 [Lysobacter sp. KIS68-7]|uniref:hypothetical protein n=1 Tax=Lysobacter sp. KIS68-7 TaxID=2904252 RepID=UPI001E5CB94D|nr:hypothetical protein [Lysobacter sp. KIS68-7]UHQ20665.1 hypothetical protein LVB87_05850 [Lysobacter sp. KIS68-7]